jgi:hypothetical protein
MTRARLYYEAHVTVEAVEGDGEEAARAWQAFKLACGTLGWRASKFSEDEVDDYHGKWFISWRGEELDATMDSIRSVVDMLEKGEYKIIRWKVEDTVYDSKHGDTLG